MRIVFTDDDEDDRHIFEWAFKKAYPSEYGSYPSLEFATDGAELIGRLENNKDLPDLIFLDINMPRMNGKEALKRIKITEGWKHITVIILSTSNSEADKSFAMKQGAKHYFVKPFEIESWIEIIRNSCMEVEQEIFQMAHKKE